MVWTTLTSWYFLLWFKD